MEDIDTLCLEYLEINPKKVYLTASEILLKILKNIVDDPNNQNYRSIRISNPNISSKLLNALGAKECLIKIGFLETDDRLTLPTSVPINSIHQYYEHLLIKRTMILSQDDLKDVKPSENYENNDENKPSTSKIPRTVSFNVPSVRVLKTSNNFLRSIEDHSLQVLAYEEARAVKMALKYIPVAMLQIHAVEKMREIQKSIKTGSCTEREPLIDDLVLLELLDWFKNSFFTWVDKPSCENCGYENTFPVGDTVFYGERVEIYKCPKCTYKTEFIRHTDPEILLETRKGRCGEWANCFTLLCRAMGWAARYVVDDSDHVWTEVYSEGEDRWLHCDPCENACDTPLMYEQGWGKHPTYIIAYGCDDIQDVTWRYTTNYKEALKRRNKCTEEELLMAIEQLRYQRQKNLSKIRKEYLAKRTLKELVELMTPRNPKSSEKQGRTSGSLTWRLARGEIKEEITKYIWNIDELSFPLLENDIRCFKLHYSITRDIYECFDNKNNVLKALKGWNNGLYYCQDIFRKEEKDWKMVYLARKENASEGKLVWHFAFKDVNYSIEQVKVKVQADVFENGNITCVICCEDICVKVKQDSTIQKYEAFKGQKCLDLKFDLSGGKGSVAWQHAQVFRQKMSLTESSMEIEITMKKI